MLKKINRETLIRINNVLLVLAGMFFFLTGAYALMVVREVSMTLYYLAIAVYGMTVGTVLLIYPPLIEVSEKK